ncbi:MAG: ribose-phosphate diphosphokinase [Novosphingobium sp.]|nr:ribose-phosphate diphosphokinase [Novosphingobium sp.]
MPQPAFPTSPPILFALGASRRFGEAVAAGLGLELSPHEERDFVDGEHKVRPLVEVGNRDVYVIHSLAGDAGQSPNDKLMRLLFFIGALKQAGAARVTAVTPYLPYARKDRRTKPRDPVNMRYVANLFEAMGTDCLMTFEIHNVAAFENAFGSCRAENLPSAAVLAEHLLPLLGEQPVAVVSPDSGGAKRANLFRTVLEERLGRPVTNALLEKHRSGGVVSGSLFAGEVEGCVAIIVDDLIASGGTIVRAAKACRERGAVRTIAAAAHGLLSDGAPALFAEDGPDMVFVCDGVEVAPSAAGQARLGIVSAAPLFAAAIARLHSGEPFYDLVPYD